MGQFRGGSPLGGSFRRRQPSRHDHVGQMVFLDDRCSCFGCGQEWEMAYALDDDGARVLDMRGREVRVGWRPVFDDW